MVAVQTSQMQASSASSTAAGQLQHNITHASNAGWLALQGLPPAAVQLTATGTNIFGNNRLLRPLLLLLLLLQDDRERYVLFSFPHIAIDMEGQLGGIFRPNRPGRSCACGALQKVRRKTAADKQQPAAVVLIANLQS
jgi:hypothetical protein